MHKRLIVIESSESFRELWTTLADRMGADLMRADEASEASGLRAVATLLACGGVETQAVERIHDAQRAGLGAPMVIGASRDHRLAVQVMRAGAADYFALPVDAPRLESVLLGLAEAPADPVGSAIGESFDFSAIIGEDPALLAAIERASAVIPGGKATVLILGETGTGKELFARALHDNGPRAQDPFVAVNCSAIPGTLLESELFGHEKGAFTDARSAKPGLFELADGGTIFLDEVSAMPPELQAKLLRFLETRELRRLGSLKTTPVDIRIVAAANQDLREMADREEFRPDLYYRLAVIPIWLPPLRERGKDVERLARHFLAQLAETYDVTPPAFSPAALTSLEQHAWRGNVRELRNAVERGLLMAGEGLLEPHHLALERSGAELRQSETEPPGSGSPIPFPARLEEVERAAARATLELFDGNKSRAARVLGITRSRLYRILERDAGAEAGSLSRSDTRVALDDRA